MPELNNKLIEKINREHSACIKEIIAINMLGAHAALGQPNENPSEITDEDRAVIAYVEKVLADPTTEWISLEETKKLLNISDDEDAADIAYAEKVLADPSRFIPWEEAKKQLNLTDDNDTLYPENEEQD